MHGGVLLNGGGQAAVGDQVNVKYDGGEKILMTVKVLNPT